MRPALHGIAILALGAALPWAAPGSGRAAEVILQNDSTVGGVPSSPGNFFLQGESVAAWLTSSCNGDIVAARVYWTSTFGGNPSSQEDSIAIFATGAFPTSGPALLNQGGAPAVVLAPLLADVTMNEYRFLDPPVNSAPLSVPVTAGQVFVVSLKFFNTSSGNPFASGPGFDADGCQSNRNGVFAVPGGWSDACLLGVTGDWVVQAVVDCAEIPVPAAPVWGVVAAALALAFVGALGARRATRPAG
jgi:hypothetical protein